MSDRTDAHIFAKKTPRLSIETLVDIVSRSYKVSQREKITSRSCLAKASMSAESCKFVHRQLAQTWMQRKPKLYIDSYEGELVAGSFIHDTRNLSLVFQFAPDVFVRVHRSFQISFAFLWTYIRILVSLLTDGKMNTS